MRKYTAKEYFELVEKFNNPIFQSWQKTELDVISAVQDSKKKTFIDLGAGYGRVLETLAKISRNVIAIEINPRMLGELNKRAKKYGKVKAIKGDLQGLSAQLESLDVQSPVLLLLQNTLGTIEGNYRKVLSEIKRVADEYKGEIIISLLRQKALKDFGMKLYGSISPMTGEPDLERTDFEKGLFVSKTGYVSTWWTDGKVEELKEYFGGKIIDEIKTPKFYILHTSSA